MTLLIFRVTDREISVLIPCLMSSRVSARGGGGSVTKQICKNGPFRLDC
jgi:hypothetical protein